MTERGDDAALKRRSSTVAHAFESFSAVCQAPSVFFDNDVNLRGPYGDGTSHGAIVVGTLAGFGMMFLSPMSQES